MLKLYLRLVQETAWAHLVWRMRPFFPENSQYCKYKQEREKSCWLPFVMRSITAVAMLQGDVLYCSYFRGLPGDACAALINNAEA